MDVNSPEIVALRRQVHAAHEEFFYAQQFHEAWRPTATDTALHERMGLSRATSTFNVIRAALRREMLLALIRVWDTNPKAVRMFSIANTLADKRVVAALAAAHVAEGKKRNVKTAGFDDQEAEAIRRYEIQWRAADVVAIISKYDESGSGRQTFEYLKNLRNERLAHREVKEHADVAEGPNATDDDIEGFYQDTLTVIRLLKAVVEQTSYSPEQTASIFNRNAMLFWAGAKGERTEGHPNFRKISVA